MSKLSVSVYIKKGIVVRKEWFGGIIYNVYDTREHYYLVSDLIADLLIAIKEGLNTLESVIELLKRLNHQITREKLKNIFYKLRKHDLIIFDEKPKEESNDANVSQVFIKIRKLNKIIENIHHKKILVSPYLITLNPTFDCNLNCIFCYSSIFSVNKQLSHPLARYHEYSIAKLVSLANFGDF